MSTKAIETVVSMMGCSGLEGCHGRGNNRCLRCAARAELDAIQQAAKTLDRLHVGDAEFEVIEDQSTHRWGTPGSKTWTHGQIVEWSCALALMTNIAKENK